MDAFDTELLIEEVKSRPELWAIGSDEFKDRNRKNNAWIQKERKILRHRSLHL